MNGLRWLMIGVTVTTCLAQQTLGQDGSPAWWGPFPGGGPNAAVSALTVYDDGGGPALCAGGSFTQAGGIVVNHVAKWNNTAWSTLGSGTNGSVGALCVFDEDGPGPAQAALFVGGSFTSAGGVAVSRIAKWNGVTWSDVGGGVGGIQTPIVYSMAVFDDGSGLALFVGGLFRTAGGVVVNNIAKWNGSAWSPLGGDGYEGTNSYGNVFALATFDDGMGVALYAGGYFMYAGDALVSSIARWDGNTWSALGDGVSGLYPIVYDLTVFDDDAGGPHPSALYAAGAFTDAGSVTANGLAQWDGQTWSGVGGGVGGGYDHASVSALAVCDVGDGIGLYAGGNFTQAGSTPANSIAEWNGTSWSPLSTGMGSTYPYVSTLRAYDAGSGTLLYVGGNFTTAGGRPTPRLARWGSQLVGDLNCDGVVDANDIEPFALALIDPAGYAVTYSSCFIDRADINQDGYNNGRDVQSFVDSLLVSP